MKRLKVSFQFWTDQNTNKLLYTSLMDPEKLKILCRFNFTNISTIYLLQERQQQLQKLWDDFNELYNLLYKKGTPGLIFYQKVVQWLEYFLTSSKSRPNQNFVRDLI